MAHSLQIYKTQHATAWGILQNIALQNNPGRVAFHFEMALFHFGIKSLALATESYSSKGIFDVLG